MTPTQLRQRATFALDYTHQSEKLSLGPVSKAEQNYNGGTAVEAKFITPLDPVVETLDGNRLPSIPVYEAHKLNVLKHKLQESTSATSIQASLSSSNVGYGVHLDESSGERSGEINKETDGKLDTAIPPSRTHPLFPPLPLYGPPTVLRSIQCLLFRTTSFFLSTGFLAVIVLGSLFTSIPEVINFVWLLLTFRDPNSKRPFYDEEWRRRDMRRTLDQGWKDRQSRQRNRGNELAGKQLAEREHDALEGGPDPLVSDPRYYARRVGLDIEEFNVQTEDGFIISLLHVYNPHEYIPATEQEHKHSTPETFTTRISQVHDPVVKKQYRNGERRYPVLLVPGLLQSAGAYCATDDDSLAFFLSKSGYDVWLGNNRCGFRPEHSLLKETDPRMWNWNIRQMGVMDLPAMISRVLEETGFQKLGLVAHSQGTTETFVALAKEQRPDLGDKISVFCALAPAVYAGPLISKIYLKFMRVISPAMFRMFFGVESFIPLMMTMHRILPGKWYGFMGYRVFSFLFDWSDIRWDRGLRDRLFQFSPVYVSSESMRWWLGRECFAKHRCILATKQEGKLEDEEDELHEVEREESNHEDRGSRAWYDDRAPPMAFWVAGRDELVDGRRLLRRFAQGREPYVQVVHQKVVDEYEHLDVIWAMDSLEKVGKEVRQVLFDTMPADARQRCQAIDGVVDQKVDTQYTT